MRVCLVEEEEEEETWRRNYETSKRFVQFVSFANLLLMEFSMFRVIFQFQ